MSQLPSRYQSTPLNQQLTDNQSREHTERMAVAVSPQYPPTPQYGVGGHTPHTNFMVNYQPAAGYSLPLEATHGAGNSRSLTNLPNSKKQRKLDYTRTTVACDHCRRRKIRCLPHFGDIQGRCANCERLNRACTYSKKDERSSSTSSQKRGARPPAGPKAISTASSPASATGSFRTATKYEVLSPSHTPQDPRLPSTKPVDVGSYATKAELPVSNFDVRDPTHEHAAMAWATTSASQGSSNIMGDASAQWRSYSSSTSEESPLTPAFPPYPTHTPEILSAWPPPQFGSSINTETSMQPEDAAWTYPNTALRSFSYGGERGGTYSPHPHVGTGHTSRSDDGKLPSTPQMQPQLGSTFFSNQSTPVPSHTAHMVPSSVVGPWQQTYADARSADYGHGGWYHHGA